ncbi:MAG: Ornithine carbamoyltransferase [Candidatus Nomurabacteria bacterium GW2011_GWB1_37_5]|uniref:Ornithine carbamoyltransferase n=1 Tax=Candidatus Nomurabacteria bacterium GW2011_GWB1_37_5 TaxID=1618742 RepID=A0A0G0K0W5_9BACT|nr:MAG: Ornithine carbamoyltransferase [Candidatus Nomurabacteria bacterium GW2011_GWB1_37_5]
MEVLFKQAARIKKETKAGILRTDLAGQTLVMIFEKPSLRTRLSFEIGMIQLGGHAVYLAPGDIGLGVRESINDVAKVSSGMGDVLMARVFKHSTICELAANSGIPVVNGLSDWEHPCQILTDLFTIWEIKKQLTGSKIVFIGDGENNIAHSLCLAAGIWGMHFVTACPMGYWMKEEVYEYGQSLCKKSGGIITQVADPYFAANQADIVYTDTWISMGDETNKEKRLNIFTPYQVTQKLMKLAKSNALFMHDLPAYRGNEVSAEVIDGVQSVVFQQAENRLHVQKALLLHLLRH